METISKTFDNPQMSAEVETIMENIKTDLQAPFVPNFFKVWGDAPEALLGIFPAMKHILASGLLDRPLKEMIILAISSHNNCQYCVAAHQAFAMMMGVGMEEIESLKVKFSIAEAANPKYKAAIDYAVKIGKDANAGTLEDIQALKAQGYTKPEILEIIAMAGMSVFYNQLADSTQINIDAAFQGPA